MGTTRKQDVDFAEHIGSLAFLEAALEWIGKNMSPEDVFSDQALYDWAEHNYSVEEG